jgi:hypothetical protein
MSEANKLQYEREYRKNNKEKLNQWHREYRLKNKQKLNKQARDNYGKWHIDHIKPLASFNLELKEEFMQACHYSNLQPLWAIGNIKKGARYE